MHTGEKVIRDMALLPQGEGQETVNISYLGGHQGKVPHVGPSNYYMKPMRPQVQIPENTSSPSTTTNHPTFSSRSGSYITLQESIQQQRLHKQPSPQSTTSISDDPTSSMVWDQSSLTSQTMYMKQPAGLGSIHSTMPGQRNLSNHMFSMIGVSPPMPSHQYPSVEDIHYSPPSNGIRSTSYMPTSYGAPLMPFPYQTVDDSALLQASPHDLASLDTSMGYTYMENNSEWNSPHLDQRLGNLNIRRQHSRSSLHPSESPSDLNGDYTPTGAIQIPYSASQYDDVYLSESPNSDPALGDEELPPYAELIYQALKGVPGNSMHLQDIYQWFRDNYAKFRDDKGKGWMNSIRHNLSMNGAFVKVERPATEPGKGYMWKLAPASLEGGIKSTTRYRKSGPAKNRSVNSNADMSYNDYVTPKRHRQGKRIQTKARRTAKKNTQRMQQVDQQQPQDYTDPFGTPSMTPDFSPRPSDTFSDTLSSSSRHATPALRNAECYQSPQYVASPYFAAEDGFRSIDPAYAYGSKSEDGFAN